MNTFEITQFMDKHGIKTFYNMNELNAEISYELSRLTLCKFEMENCFQMKQYIFAFPAKHLIQFIKDNPSFQDDMVEDGTDMSALFDVEEIQEQFKTKEELEKLFKNVEYDFNFYLLYLDKQNTMECVLLMTQ